LAQKLDKRYDRFGTLTDRNWLLTRLGEGLDTDYDIESEGESKFASSKYTPLDLGEVLMKSRSWALSEEDADDEDEAKPAPKATKSAPAPAKAPAKKAAAPKAEAAPKGPNLPALGKAADVGGDKAIETLTELAEAAGLDPDEYDTWAELAEALGEVEGGEDDAPEAEEAAADDDDVITEEKLAVMSLRELKAVCAELDIEIEAGWKADDMREAILALAEDAD
jgi:hypothetical protein